MAWVRISDDFYDHPKFQHVTALGTALFVTAVAWCNRNLSDGHISYRALSGLVSYDGLKVVDGRFDVTVDDAINELIEAGLFEPDPDGGFTIHDFLDFQPSKAEIEQKRSEKRAAGKKGAATRWGKDEADDMAAPMAGAMGGAMAPAIKMAPAMAPAMANGWQNDAPNPNPKEPTKTNDHRGSKLTRATPHDDLYKVWFQQHRVSPDQVLARLNANGAEHTPGDVVVLFDALSRLASAPIVNGTAYLLAAIEQTPGEVEKILAGGEAA